MRIARAEPNAILCTMLTGDAVYASSLSSKHSLPARIRPDYQDSNKKVVPVRYMVVYGGNSADQLGRLVRRLHYLGELRHVGLHDYAEIVTIGQKLQRLGSDIAHAIDNCTTHPKTFDRKRANRIVAEYVTIARSCHGGLSYRTARSQFYRELIQTTIGDLYAAEIPGWQSYPGFIRRNFDRRFKSVQSVGERYRDIGTRVDRLISLSDTARQYNFGSFPLFFGIIGAALAVSTFLLRREWPTRPEWLNVVTIGCLDIALGIVVYLALFPPSRLLRPLRAYALWLRYSFALTFE